MIDLRAGGFHYAARGQRQVGTPTALCGELLSTGTFASTSLFERQFSDGRPIWDWMLQGGYTTRYRYPEEVPVEISVTEVARVLVTLGKLAWEIRAIRVTPSAGRLSVEDGWPKGERPPNATHPTASG